MTVLTEKYIFVCKLKGKPVQVDTAVLYHEGILQMLTKTGVWEKEPAQTNKFWNEYSFTILYPIQLLEENTEGNYDCMALGVGDHHLVCL